MSGTADAAELARQATERILADLAGAERGVVVDSPPGAGKSTLVVRAAAELAAAGERVMIVGQTNEQVDDLTDRLAAAHPGRPAGRLSAHGYAPSERVARLDPFSAVQTERWLGLSWDPMSSAVAVLLNHNPGIPVHTLPVSWRLPASAAPVVSEAFYPFSGFTSATAESGRRLGWNTRSFGANTLRTDGEAVRACAGLAARLLERGAHTLSERAVAPLPVSPSRVAVGTAHRDQAVAVRRALAELGAGDVVADTANRLQGREFDVVIVLHPLSGRRDATAFHLEAGRLCVLTSRHRHACVVVARAGITELLDAHPSVEPVHLGVPAKFPDGWEANQSMMSRLSKWRVPAV